MSRDAIAVTPSAVTRLVDAGCLSDDPRPWLLSSGEPYTVWAALAGLVDDADGRDIDAAHAAVLADHGVQRLIAGLQAPDETSADHHSPAFLPNRLNLLADMGVTAGDDERVDALLDGLLARQQASGRFESVERLGRTARPEWGSMRCETNVITDLLLRFGRGGDERVQRAVKRLVRDSSVTRQGRAWQCVPEVDTRSRSIGRGDLCPQVTLEGLRALSHVPASEQPDWIEEAVRTPLGVWRRRVEERPHAFGHGYQFKSVKWPNFWYDVLWLLETLGRFPRVWRGPGADDEDRRALSQIAACLLAYNFDGSSVTPRRTYRGFEEFSFGQKKSPSPFATARALIALARVADLAKDIAGVDVVELPSSRGSSATALPPGGEERRACPAPAPRPYALARAIPRVLARHHLDLSWETASPESVVADVVALHANVPATPYVSLQARLPVFAKRTLDDAVGSRRSLVRYRGMRGQLYVFRRDFLPVVHGATNRAVVRYARRFAESRGVTPDSYEQLVVSVLEILQDGAKSTKELRARLNPRLDLAAALALMSAEGLVLRETSGSDWLDRGHMWASLAKELPDMRLDSLDELDARARLLVAYVRAFGPATPRDAAWWTGISPDNVRRTINRLEDELVEVRLAESEDVYLMHAADVEELERATILQSPAVSLLPALDPLLMGYADRSRLLDDEYRPYVFDPSGNATSVVLVNGTVAGIWDVRTTPSEAVLVHLLADSPLTVRDVVAIKAAAVGRFWFDAEVPVLFEPNAVPIAHRSVGAFAKPLR